MPNHTLPQIPVPKDKIDAAFSIPLGFSHNGSQPGVINVAYKEEWVGESLITPFLTQSAFFPLFPLHVHVHVHVHVLSKSCCVSGF
jgi:hypothetical protein